MVLVRILLLAAPALVGAGLAWWVHPGAGMTAAGLLVWIDLQGLRRAR